MIAAAAGAPWQWNTCLQWLSAAAANERCFAPRRRELPLLIGTSL